MTDLTDPDRRTANDDEATEDGVSTPEPAEGSDETAPKQPGSPRG